MDKISLTQLDLYPPLYSRQQRTVQTMDTQRFSATKEGKNGLVSRKGYGNYYVLEFSWSTT